MIPKTIRTLATAAALFAAGGTAFADDSTMSGDQLDALLTGNTVYIDVPAGGSMGDGGEMPLYYGSDGAVHARLPTGSPMVGVYAIDGASYCVDWDPAPKGSCTSIVRGGEGGMTLVDPAKDETRGTVTRIVPGDVESLGSRAGAPDGR